MDPFLTSYVREHCITDARFDALFMHGEHHCLRHVFKLFDVCEHNEFNPPWSGQWITAQQAYRLIGSMYDVGGPTLTPVTMSIMQFVFDWWNIGRVFGTDHVFHATCGYPSLRPRQLPPLLGPRRRMTSNEFAMVWCR